MAETIGLCWRDAGETTGSSRFKIWDNVLIHIKKKKLNVPSDSECNDNRAWSRQRRRRREACVPKWIKLILKNLIFFFDFFFLLLALFFVLFVLKGCNFKASAPCERLPADLGVKTRNMSRASRSGAAGSTAAVLLRFIRPIRLCDPARRRDVPTLPCHSVLLFFFFLLKSRVRMCGNVVCKAVGGAEELDWVQSNFLAARLELAWGGGGSQMKMQPARLIYKWHGVRFRPSHRFINNAALLCCWNVMFFLNHFPISLGFCFLIYAFVSITNSLTYLNPSWVFRKSCRPNQEKLWGCN